MLICFLHFFKARQAVPKARSGGWLNTMPFHKTPGSGNPQGLSCGMTQRVLAGPDSDVISHAMGATDG